jgi:hypothetical protein
MTYTFSNRKGQDLFPYYWQVTFSSCPRLWGTGRDSGDRRSFMSPRILPILLCSATSHFEDHHFGEISVILEAKCSIYGGTRRTKKTVNDHYVFLYISCEHFVKNLIMILRRYLF